jgi:tetratricopeptide (TPR) repeat protein
MAALPGTQQGERLGQANVPAVQSLAYLATCHGELGLFTAGRELGEAGLQIAETVAHPSSLMWAAYGLGLLACCQGDLPRALLRLEQALGICQDADLRLFVPRVAAALGAAYSLSGRLTDAVAVLTPALEQTRATDMGGFQALCLLPLGAAQLLAGHLEEAHTLTQRTLLQTQERQERGHEAYALRLLGAIAARREPPESHQAVAYYRQALTLAEELGMRPLQAHCHRGIGLLYATTGQQEQAHAELSTAIAMYQSMEMPFWLPETEAALVQVEGR